MSEHNHVDDSVPTTVKHDLVTLDRVFDKTNLDRNSLALKLQTAIEEMELNKDDPKLMTAQMTLVKTYMSILDSKDTNVRSRVGSKLKQVETEATSKHSAAVADLLTKISVSGNNLKLGSTSLSQEEIERQIEQEYEASGLGPILNSELKMDPKDLSE